jgi:UDP-N-acetylmuramyl pentapeptide phosphotransferase/UDP-N-acetylglucosamine-1-phosphate transferase
MEYSVLQFFLLGALTFIFVGAITPLMRKVALGIGAVDAPNLARKVQKSPVPYLGGVAIALGVVGASYGSLLAVDFSMETFRLESFVLVPAMAILVMGIVDGRYRGSNPDIDRHFGRCLRITTVAVTSRIYRGISPFQGGTDHLSHRLMRVGLTRRLTVFTLWGLAALYGALALCIYTWPDSAGYQLMAIGAAAWLFKLVYFLRIPSSGVD